MKPNTRSMMSKTTGISQTNSEQKCTGPRPGSHKCVLGIQEGSSDCDVGGNNRVTPGKQKTSVQLRTLQWVQGPYLTMTKVPRSPASHCGTGFSEPRQGAPTPPGRSVWPRP